MVVVLAARPVVELAIGLVPTWRLTSSQIGTGLETKVAIGLLVGLAIG